MSSTPSIVTKHRTTLTIDQLRLSPFNVRTDLESISPAAIAVMEGLLTGQGQLEEILVHPMKGNSKIWGANAGGRRYRAFKNLIESGRLPRDHLIKVEIRTGMSDADLVEESMSENIGRRDLEPYETFAGVRKAHRLGHDVEQIARALGQEQDAIARMLRLGNLAKPIFDALAAREIDEDQARAFGATEDVDAQLAAWQQLKVGVARFTHPTDRIRAALGIGDQALDKLLALVGADTYVAAGGRLEPDLFGGPGARGRIVDAGKLRELAETALERVRIDQRHRTGRPDLRFVTQEPRTAHDTTDWQLKAEAVDGPKDTIKLPDGDIVARVYVDQAGLAQVDYWWASRSAKYVGNRPARDTLPSPRTANAVIEAEALKPAAAIAAAGDGCQARQIADAAIKQEEGLSVDSVGILRSQRRAILRGLLIDDAIAGGDVAADYLVWTQLRLAMDMYAEPRKLGICHKIGGDADPEVAKEHVRAMPASALWRDTMDELRQQSFVTGDDLERAFGDYRASPQRLKKLATAAVAGWSLERSLAADGYVVPVHDELARQLGVMSFSHDATLRRYWTPTEQLLGRIPVRQALEIAKPFVDADAFAAWGKAKAAQVIGRLLQLVSGEQVHGRRADRAAAAAEWVHPLLRFAPASSAPDEQEPAAAERQAA